MAGAGAGAPMLVGWACQEPGCRSANTPYRCSGLVGPGVRCMRIACDWHGALTRDGQQFFCSIHAIQRLMYDQGLMDPDAAGDAAPDLAPAARPPLTARRWEISSGGVWIAELTFGPASPSDPPDGWLMAL